jgi:hypothetical protein
VESKGGGYDGYDTDGEDGDHFETASQRHRRDIQEEYYW